MLTSSAWYRRLFFRLTFVGAAAACGSQGEELPSITVAGRAASAGAGGGGRSGNGGAPYGGSSTTPGFTNSGNSFGSTPTGGSANGDSTQGGASTQTSGGSSTSGGVVSTSGGTTGSGTTAGAAPKAGTDSGGTAGATQGASAGEPSDLGEGGESSAGAGGAAAVGGAGGSSGEADVEAGAGGASGGEGGEPSVVVFESITALYDAVDDGELTDGDTWRVAWDADTRVAAGSITGTLTAGVIEPSIWDHGALPLKLFTEPDWSDVGTDAGFTMDGDGYPTLSRTADAADAGAAARLNYERYAFRRFTRVRLRIDQDLTGTSQYSSASLELWDAEGDNRLIGSHVVMDATSDAQAVASWFVQNASQTFSNGTSTAAHDRAFEGYWNLVPATPFSANLSMTMRLEPLQGAALGADTTVIQGHGNWSQDTGLDYGIAVSLWRTAGGSGTATATAISVEVTRYEP